MHFDGVVFICSDVVGGGRGGGGVCPGGQCCLKAAVGTCTQSGFPPKYTCTGGCLGETPDGSCPTFAASNDASGNPYGVIGDWDVSKVTSLASSTFTPPLLFSCPLVLSLGFSQLTPIAFIFYVFPVFLFLDWINHHTAPTSSYSVLWCFCIQRGHFQVEHCGGDDHVCKYVHSSCFCCYFT